MSEVASRSSPRPCSKGGKGTFFPDWHLKWLVPLRDKITGGLNCHAQGHNPREPTFLPAASSPGEQPDGARHPALLLPK